MLPEGESASPRVFLSHATEDQERFVRAFAEQLRQRGVDVWYSEWEILPGDSLVDKIFEEGLRDATAVIVVISEHSVHKPWVREELNIGVIKRINRGSLLIPVVLDGVKVPEALNGTVWEPISDLEEFGPSLDRIKAAIFQQRHRPRLGSAPEYADAGLPSVPGLEETDVAVLKEFGAMAVETGDWIGVDTEAVWSRVERLGVSRESFEDALQILQSRLYLEKSKVIAPIPPYFKVTVSGLEEYLRRFYAVYGEVFKRVVAEIVNNQVQENDELASSVGHPQIIVDHVLRRLKRSRLARVRESIGGHISVSNPTPELRRWLRG